MSTKKHIIKELQTEVENFLVRHDMFATHFGRLAANNTALVGRIRTGNIDSLRLVDDTRRFMIEYDKKKRKNSAKTAEIAA